MKKIKPFSRPWILAYVIIALLVGGFLIVRDNDTSSNSAPGDDVSLEDQKKAADINSEAKKDFVEKSDPQPTEAPPKNVSLIAQMGANNDIVVLTKLISIGSGSCELLASNGSKQISQTAEVIYQPEYSTCAGFTVSKSSLGSGTWTLRLTVTSGGESTVETITYEVM